ncbi:MAG: tetratricopeptide repeat protein [Beijerinckiaceae bacterium]
MGEGVKHHQAGRLSEAEACYRRVLAAQPDHPDALHLLGVIAHQVGRHDLAVELIDQAIKRNQQHPIYFCNLGVALLHQGKIDEAIAAYHQAIRLKPDYAEAFNNCGIALKELKRLDEALASYDQALALKPDYAEAFYNRGNALLALKRLDAALANYDKALELKPNYAEVFNNRGVALQDLKRFDEALASHDKALALKPDYAEAFNNRGLALQDLKRFDEALASHDKALALKPDYAEAFNNRGLALQALKRFFAAAANHDKALALKPSYAEAFHDRGNALKEMKRLDEALASYEKALAIRPDYVEALNSRGNALTHLKRPEEALASYDKALAIKPDYAEALSNRGMTALLMGNFLAGWSGYEHRWDEKGAPPLKPIAPYPAWQGEDIQGKRIIVYEEQGLGDTIQFSRFLTPLSSLGAGVTFLVRSSMHRLLQPFASTIRLIDKPPHGESFDFQCALLSLPAVMGTTLNTVPSDIPYLIPEAPLVAKWRQHIGNHGLKIGICWQGSRLGTELGKSFHICELQNISKLPGVRLISLQKNEGSEQIAELPDGMKMETLGEEFDAGFDGFLDSAAVMENLDLIITTDTSIAHLAGALGRPVWILLPFVPDWRWLLDRDDSPWYPTARLFRQTDTGNWRGVVDRVREALRDLVEPQCADRASPLRASSPPKR